MNIAKSGLAIKPFFTKICAREKCRSLKDFEKTPRIVGSVKAG